MDGEALFEMAEDEPPRSRRAILGAALLLGAALFVGSAAPAMAARPPLRRVIVTLLDDDRDAELEELLDALRGYRYRLVRVDEDRPTVVLDASDKAIRMLRRLNIVASLRIDEPTAPPEPKVESFRVAIDRNYDFDDAVETIRDALESVRHKILRIDPVSSSMIVAMRESDIPMIAALTVVRNVTVYRGDPAPDPGDEPPPGDVVTPIPGGETPMSPDVSRAKTHRVIVTFAGTDRNAEIRRILKALDGTVYSVVTRFEVTPAIVLKVDDRGLKRLRALPGVRLQSDSLSAPL